MKYAGSMKTNSEGHKNNNSNKNVKKMKLKLKNKGKFGMCSSSVIVEYYLIGHQDFFLSEYTYV